MAFDIKFETPELPESLKGNTVRDMVIQEAKRAGNEAVTKVRNEMVRVSTVGATGLQRQSWQAVPAKERSDGAVVSRVVSSEVQALINEEGAKPHFPPEEPLELWVRRKRGVSFFTTDKKGNAKSLKMDVLKDVKRVAFAIRRSINRTGFTPAKKIFSKAFRRIESQIAEIYNRMAERIERRIEGPQ